MKRTISTFSACVAMAVVFAAWAAAGAARAQECATCGGGGGAQSVIDSGAPCGTCDSCGSCATCGGCSTCPTCGHPLLAIPLFPIRVVLGALGDMFHCTGCGCETYYGDDWCGCGHGCCEPCDTCGNYVGGCGRCGPGGLRGLLFGDGASRGTTVSDGTVVDGDVMVGNRPAYNAPQNSGVCPTCGRNYTNAAPAPRGAMVSAGSNANRGYATNANTNANVRYSNGNTTASYRGNSTAPTYNANANYGAVRASYNAPARSPSPQVDLSNLPPGRFSPKVISVTDEIVSPAGADTQSARAASTTTR